jgi:hypothetical protein
MRLTGIFERQDGTYYWIDYMDEYEIEEAKYFVDDDNDAGVHVSKASLLYDDMTDYVDELQHEEDLSDGELYVVCYFWTDCPSCLYQEVDFGITKQEIIENVKNQKYVEGAEYYTMGQMLYETRKMMKQD